MVQHFRPILPRRHLMLVAGRLFRFASDSRAKILRHLARCLRVIYKEMFHSQFEAYQASANPAWRNLLRVSGQGAGQP